MTKSGVPTNVQSTPPGANVGGTAFTPLTADQYALIVAAWSHDKSVTVTYDMGPPMTIVNVVGA